jgi:hypothetical protein
MVNIINPMKQKTSEWGWLSLWGYKRVNLHIYSAAYCGLFDSSSITDGNACHYRQGTRFDPFYGSRIFSASSSSLLFLAPSIFNPQQAAEIKESKN